ncbi:MAG TPA: type I-E CRISPR-associated protein Cas7/Cse4/CasC [Candidatus Dormibacteraeota bacterium]|nr:type I-E CRISPR-associated protein Cas7/Cse4/CasC [Candidatus Dormibacteraeota bacterium]
MSRFIQLHLLTFYPPSNLNRDDTGRPKTATVGGVPRLRISSQALKRAWRTSPIFAERLHEHRGQRTQRFGEDIERHLREQGVAAERALKIAREIAQHFGKLKPERDTAPARTEQLAFIGPEERAAALALADRIAAGEAIAPTADQLLRQSDTAADIAMFGRMLADNPQYNREAAVQVAHAITTHRVTVEDDYYTAIDDLKTADEDAGAGFVGELGFGSGIFYLYACIDTELLVRNLDGHKALAADASAALVEAASTVSPKGKQPSFAARARAHYVLAEFGTAQPRTLAGAFVKPVQAEDLAIASVAQLADWRAKLDHAYGPAADATAIMDVATGQGTLDEIIGFCRDAASHA